MRWEAREEEWRDALVNLHILFWSGIALSRFFFHLHSFEWVSAFLLLTPIIEHILISEFIATSGLGFFFPQSQRDSHLLSEKGNFRVQKDKKLAPNKELEIDTSLTFRLAARWPITLSNNTIQSLTPPHRKATSFWLLIDERWWK